MSKLTYGGHPDNFDAKGWRWFDLPSHRLHNRYWDRDDEYVRLVADLNPHNVRVNYQGHSWPLSGKGGFDDFDAMLAWVKVQRDKERARENHKSPPTWVIRAVPMKG